MILKAGKKLYPVEFAALAHKQFIFIHPFIDENGKLARLLMNLAWLRNEYSIALIPSLLRSKYITCQELAYTDEKSFKEFIADRVISTQLDLLQLLKDGSVNSLNGGVNNKIESADGGVISMEIKLLHAIKTTPGLNTPDLSINVNISLRTIQRYL